MSNKTAIETLRSIIEYSLDAGDQLEATAALDQLEAQQQPKRLTDAEIKRIADAAIPPFTGMNSSHSFRVEHHHEGALKALLYARDNGYIGGLSVDEVIEITMAVAAEHYKGYVFQGQSVGSPTRLMRNDLRARLSAKLQER